MQLPRQLEFPKRVAQATLDDEVPDLAAGLAYRFLFAIFPFAIFLAALAGFVAQLAGLQDPSGQLMGAVTDNLPPDIAAQVRPQLDAVLGNAKPGLLSIGAVLALWAAMGGIGAVMKAMNSAYDVKETRGFVPKTLRAALLTVFGALGILIAFVTVVGGSLLTQQAVRTFGIPDSAWSVASILRFPLVIVLVAVAVAILYRFGPNVAVSPRYTLIGGFAFAITWLLATVVFGIYVANFGNYSNTYGALGGAVVLMLWFYITALLLLVGAELTAQLAKEREPHKIAARKREISDAVEARESEPPEPVPPLPEPPVPAPSPEPPEPPRPHPDPVRPDPVPAPWRRRQAHVAAGPRYVASNATTRVIAVAVVAAGAVTGAIAGLLARDGGAHSS